MRRHDLAFVDPTAWRTQFPERAMTAFPLVVNWVDNGWPLIGRRALAGEAHGVALGLPLPPFAGKGRMAFVLRPEDIVQTAPPPALALASGWAPQVWKATIDRVHDLADRYAIEVRVFGSLAWRTLTDLDYLTDKSDLDLLLYVNCATDIHGLVAGLASIESAAPMRLDGELIREDAVAVNWREFHTGAHEVLVKELQRASLMEAGLFSCGAGVP